MEIVRHNTDYAFRMMVDLASRYGDESAAATGSLANSADITNQFAAKILQKLQKAGLVKSIMGPKGGFILAKKPAKINLLDIMEAMQGQFAVNKCLLGDDRCHRKPNCPVNKKLDELQGVFIKHLSDISLKNLIDCLENDM
jgi:Rrf2 family protein